MITKNLTSASCDKNHIFNAYAEFIRQVNGRFHRKNHAFLKDCLAAGRNRRAFMNLQPHPMTQRVTEELAEPVFRQKSTRLAVNLPRRNTGAYFPNCFLLSCIYLRVNIFQKMRYFTQKEISCQVTFITADIHTHID